MPPQIGILEWYVAKSREIGADKLNLPYGLMTDMVHTNADMMALVKGYTDSALTTAFRPGTSPILGLPCGHLRDPLQGTARHHHLA